jgi:hypothetical protein
MFISALPSVGLFELVAEAHRLSAFSARIERDPLFITEISFTCTLNSNLDGFTLCGTFMADSPRATAYLFLFTPQVELADGRITVTIPPDNERYYWAFDPTGDGPLTHEQAEDIGLPTPEFSTDVRGMGWDQSDNEMIRDFHLAKGFDPNSQDAAIAIGSPLVDIEGIKKFAREVSLHQVSIPAMLLHALLIFPGPEYR